MDELISVKELKEMKFKQVAGNLWIKNRIKYIRCAHCHKLTRTTDSVGNNNKLFYMCFWCKQKGAIKMPMRGVKE